MELIEHLDRLGYDEAWIGEHHSAGSEIIGSPEIFIAVAAERTSRIRLGTGVVSLPYHHPLWVAERMVLLDHLTRGRVMLGVGPGALVTDAVMIGIQPSRQREMMTESLRAILHLLRSEEPLTVETSWFTLREARLQLRPYTHPHFEVAVAAAVSPTGPALAGRYGLSMLSLGATTDIGFDALGPHWNVVEEQARLHGTRPERGGWRLVGPMHVAETKDQAVEQCRYGLMRWFDYLQQVATVPQMQVVGSSFEERVEFINGSGMGVIGTPEQARRQVERLRQQSGGFGAYLLMAHEWANPQDTLSSFDLFAREVMPEFQGVNVSLRAADERARSSRPALFALGTQALQDATARYNEQMKK